MLPRLAEQCHGRLMGAQVKESGQWDLYPATHSRMGRVGPCLEATINVAHDNGKSQAQ